MVFEKYKMTSPFGERTLENGDSRFHYGIDFVGVDTDKVLATTNGVVVRSRIVTNKSSLTSEWGNYICIVSDDGYYHYYCHLLTRYLKVGDKVNKGDIIGVMGNSGYSLGVTGLHTHYEIRNKSNVSIDPQAYFNLKLVLYKIYEFNDMSITRATQIVQEKAQLEDVTINYLLKYPYASELMTSLANAIECKNKV